MNDDRQTVFTIGHSTHSLEQFAALLLMHCVTTVADIRSAPYSRHNPQFNKDALERGLKRHGLKYVFLGRELGGRSQNPSHFEGGHVHYSRLAATTSFQEGRDRIIHGLSFERIALMCAEKEPLECHRSLLVAQSLAERGIDVVHILADGALETHEQALSRLLGLVGLPPQDMFRSREELVSEAIARQEKRVAYAMPPTEGEMTEGGP